jgi:hypothetical protein
LWAGFWHTGIAPVDVRGRPLHQFSFPLIDHSACRNIRETFLSPRSPEGKTMQRTAGLSLLTAVSLLAPIAWACGACVKDILSLHEFDQTSWDHYQNVYVGLVTRAELAPSDDATRQITYSLVPEEIFKGDPNATEDVHSRRVVDSWDSEVRRVACGDEEIFIGDRLLVFSNPGEAAYVGRCSASRVVERMNTRISPETRETLERMREWRTSP